MSLAPANAPPTATTATKLRPKSIKKGGNLHTHAVDTARGILIGRVDAMLGDIEAIVEDVAGDEISDASAREELAIRLIQALQVRLFPEEFLGRAYTPDPAGRTETPTRLIPRIFTQATAYTAHLLAGRKSPAAKLIMPDGQPVLTDADLTRLGERMERRATSDRVA